jgi:hypothetical protein
MNTTAIALSLLALNHFAVALAARTKLRIAELRHRITPNRFAA